MAWYILCSVVGTLLGGSVWLKSRASRGVTRSRGEGDLTRPRFVVIKTTVVVTSACAVVFLFNHFSPALIAHAQSIADPNSSLQQGVQVIQQPLGLPVTDLRLIIANIIRVALGFLGLIFLVLVLYGGYLWMTAGGNEEQIATAKKILTNGVIGLIIIVSAYGIVLMVMRILGIGGTGIGEGGGGGGAVEQNFVGSSALGGIIKDHYPARNQQNVPRNTKIIITFRKPIKLTSSWVQDISGDGVLGNCRNTTNLNWVTDCDHLILNSNYIAITRADNNQSISGASLIASYDQNNQVSTIVIRPDDPLGSSTTTVPYLVHIGSGITLDDPSNPNISIFASSPPGGNYYEWQFTCSTALDTTPPHIVSVYPGSGDTVVKNSVIQITFSKAMDPTNLQGAFTSQSSYFALSGNTVFLKSDHSSLPAGTFNLTNGYKTLEFTPSTACGQNACGGTIYCLPVCDQTGANCTTDSYELLLRAATTMSANSFEAVPFSGIMDVVGNALDGNNDGKVEQADATQPVFATQTGAASQETPDNYFWSFTINNTLDATAPYLIRVKPGLDAQNIASTTEWSMLFSKRMRVDPMYNISLDENPASAAPLCRVPRVQFITNANGSVSTLTTMDHCPFLTDTRHDYMPTIDSSVEDVNFNCFYPGKGPNDVIPSGSSAQVSADCAADGTNCCAVQPTPQSQAFCCDGLPNAADRASCLSALQAH